MTRYKVHDTQATTASHLRRPSTIINPRYWVIDTTTGKAVDEFTTKKGAMAAARHMNREQAYYLEYANGNCSIVRSGLGVITLKAREKATLVRPATEEDITDFVRMGGMIR